MASFPATHEQPYVPEPLGHRDLGTRLIMGTNGAFLRLIKIIKLGIGLNSL